MFIYYTFMSTFLLYIEYPIGYLCPLCKVVFGKHNMAVMSANYKTNIKMFNPVTPYQHIIISSFKYFLKLLFVFS